MNLFFPTLGLFQFKCRNERLNAADVLDSTSRQSCQTVRKRFRQRVAIGSQIWRTQTRMRGRDGTRRLIARPPRRTQCRQTALRLPLSRAGFSLEWPDLKLRVA